MKKMMQGGIVEIEESRAGGEEFAATGRTVNRKMLILTEGLLYVPGGRQEYILYIKSVPLTVGPKDLRCSSVNTVEDDAVVFASYDVHGWIAIVG